MADIPSSSAPQPNSASPSLPSGYMTIKEIRSIPDAKIKQMVSINVIGLVTDFQTPVKTKGPGKSKPHYMCTLEIKDVSTQYEPHGIRIYIFYNELPRMPQTCGLLDAVLIRKAKCQMRNGQVTLLTSRATELFIMAASTIPKSVADLRPAVWMSYPPTLKLPRVEETCSVVQAKRALDNLHAPSTEEFEKKVNQTLAVKDKFSLLKDVKAEKYYNIIVEVIRIYDSNPVTLYVSDYTAHSEFYDNAWKSEVATSMGRDGDKYGYIKPKPKDRTTNFWPGPYGKLSIQLTAFHPHADYAREAVKLNQWLLLRNVQMRCGKMGGCLEAFLRTDGDKVNIEILQASDQPEENDARWKEAVRRKRDYWKSFERQKEKYDREIAEAEAGMKRKASEELENQPLNSKMRRKLKRDAGYNKAALVDAKVTEKLDLNENGMYLNDCLWLTTLPLKDILKPQKYYIDSNKQEIIMPFINARYRANVRVVGYFPHKIEDFAVGRRITEMDMLSDYSGGEDTDHEEDRRIFKEEKSFGKYKWDWRFALEVEDAGSQLPKERTWLVVDNFAAQGLLDMEAENLRANPSMLAEFKEKLCILWGDLEEQKFALPKKPTAKAAQASSHDDPISPALKPIGAQPNIDSDDENDLPPRQPASKLPTKPPLQLRYSTPGTSAEIDPPPPVKNKAFTCCIRQYGVKVHESDPSKATAGNSEDGTGKRWERKFGLFGVSIV
ncbi:hypothetical protein BJ878DRAFT_424199 [Calycina marina]|uniref:Protection of telomeres protein 1 n=1 Tax=Calycina marina TaxID=1763456 RepID=A0A9P7Z0I9_9HELO|nr:hypothetical protein BJ878DRAFT_424199 [Calycina marina]